MEFVADESCAGPAIRALREAGHDVIAIAEIAKGAADEAIMERAFSEGRVLITEDSDFGELVYASGRPSPGRRRVTRASASHGENARPASPSPDRFRLGSAQELFLFA